MQASPRFTGLHLFVRDMDASRAFYRRLGFDVPDNLEMSSFALTENVRVALGSYELTRGYHEGWQPPGAGSIALQFDVPARQAVDDLHADLIAAAPAARCRPSTLFGARGMRRR
jgi:catechol 2,3-dioxygenase-like lactoylglutathione lyase family enzyme